jgi:hypothetical protein
MDFHVLSTHCKDGADVTPLQFISAERLAYLLALEAAVGSLLVLVDRVPREIAEPMQP